MHALVVNIIYPVYSIGLKIELILYLLAGYKYERINIYALFLIFRFNIILIALTVLIVLIVLVVLEVLEVHIVRVVRATS